MIESFGSSVLSNHRRLWAMRLRALRLSRDYRSSTYLVADMASVVQSEDTLHYEGNHVGTGRCTGGPRTRTLPLSSESAGQSRRGCADPRLERSILGFSSSKDDLFCEQYRPARDPKQSQRPHAVNVGL